MTKEVKTGMMAFIILVVAMAVFLFVRPKDWFDGNYFRMTASFSSVQGIKKGNEVRYAGVRVGEVSKISTEGNEGILEMRLDQMMERAKKLKDSAVKVRENIGKMEGK